MSAAFEIPLLCFPPQGLRPTFAVFIIASHLLVTFTIDLIVSRLFSIEQKTA